MSRLLKILLYAVVLFFLFLWVSTLVKSCGSDNTSSSTERIAEATDESSEETYEEDDFFEDDEGEEDEASGEDTYEEDAYEEEEDEVEQIDYTEIDKVVEDKLNEPTKDDRSPTSNSGNTNVTKGTSSGKYMVIAGSFLIEKNAENMRNRLNNLGYDNASLVVFDLSQYHSVVAARFSTYEAALKVSNELKRRGMDCYVHAQQF